MQVRPAVVVGVDGSTESREALRYALEEAARRNTGVEIVSAFLPPQYRPNAYGLSAPPTPYEIKSDLRVIALRMLDDVVAQVPALASVPAEFHELEGRPAEVLIERARDADLLVVGHRGRGGFASALLGSVGLQCVVHAECPVTVVRPQPQTATATDAKAETAPADRPRDRVRVADSAVAPVY